MRAAARIGSTVEGLRIRPDRGGRGAGPLRPDRSQEGPAEPREARTTPCRVSAEVGSLNGKTAAVGLLWGDAASRAGSVHNGGGGRARGHRCGGPNQRRLHAHEWASRGGGGRERLDREERS